MRMALVTASTALLKIESVPSYVSEIGNAIDALSSGIMKAKEDSWKHYSKKDIKDAIENLHTYI